MYISHTAADAEAATRAWVRTMVIGLNLCPFAKGAEDGGRVRYAATEATDRDAVYQFFLAELERLVLADPKELETTLVIFPNHLQHFDDYLDFLEIAEDCIVEADLEGVVQVASFHPDYYFQDEDPADVSNYTNRAPHPVLHLLREDTLTLVLDTYPDAEEIPVRNVKLMREMGEAQIKALLGR
jgi:uncharacterized protein